MKKTLSITAVFFVTLFMFILSEAELFAEPNQHKMIKELEKMENAPGTGPELILRPNIEYDAQDFRDPFSEPAPDEKKSVEIAEKSAPVIEKLPDLAIQGLIWGGEISQAIVNNKVVKEGDSIEGAKVISIRKHGITVLFKGKEYDIASMQSKAGSNIKP
ncbi:MAG: hypothetical protein A3K83_01195 [Omnitrophica WOR_2 bacterium RBG_13_44_8b]|nr:MAG: hypothetical protein A3K83_01195 [Omnitrophica WOR_2 bacterium RBG_13_44_8b]